MKSLLLLAVLCVLGGRAFAAPSTVPAALPAGEPEQSEVFVAGKDGYKSIRIPSVVVTKAGTVLAFAEGRAAHADQANNKLILKRSHDGGRTWGAVQQIADDGANTLNNPTAVVEQQTGRVLVMYQSYPAGISERDGKIKPGHDGPAIVRNYLLQSEDDGATWSKPLDVTRTTKRPERVTITAVGPGLGLQLTRGPHAGRLLMPFNEGPFGVWNVAAAFSDDRGATWQLGSPAPGALIPNGKGGQISLVNEVQMAELDDGSVMLNARKWGGTPFRKTAISHDGGATWSPLEQDKVLNDPGCMASLFRYSFSTATGPSRLLYSGPDSSKRENGVVRMSFDEGKTWPVRRVLFPGSFAYSVLTRFNDGTIGCLYETDDANRHVFARFSLDWLNSGTNLAATVTKPAAPFPVPTIDLAAETQRQVIVDREAGQYLGHPTTVLLEDGRTILTVYPKGHGKGGIVYKRSADGGLTWSDRLPTPASWATSREVPTLHRVVDAAGKKRLIMWSGLYPARLAVSEDDGATWGELKQVGAWGGIVVMGFTEPLKTPGHYLAMFHDDGRYFTAKAAPKKPVEFTLFKTFSRDGGLTWSAPEAVQHDTAVHLCEPGFIRSPDGKEIAVLLRENSRTKNSHVIFSRDEGQTWTAPRELPDSLNGDRHTGKYLPDGRLFVSFRSVPPRGKPTPFAGDWVAWVGRYEDLAMGRPGQYHLRLLHNTKGYDCAYPGVLVLPDATIVTTTYGHWTSNEAPYIVSVRLQLAELDAKARAAK